MLSGVLTGFMILRYTVFFWTAINEALRNEVESLKIANAELRTPTEPCPFGAPRRVPYSPSDSPSTLTPQPPVHFSPLTSPSTLQSPTHSTQPLTSPSTVQLPVHITPPLTSPSTVNLPVHYSPLTSPSTVQTIHFSPLTSPSLVQTVPFTQIASPSTPQTTTTIPRPSVYAVAPLPPLHKSRSSIISRRLRQANLVTPTEQNDSSGGNSKGPDVVNGEGAPVSTSRSGSATPWYFNRGHLNAYMTDINSTGKKMPWSFIWFFNTVLVLCAWSILYSFGKTLFS